MRPEEELVDAALSETAIEFVRVVEGFVVLAFPNVPSDRKENCVPNPLNFEHADWLGSVTLCYLSFRWRMDYMVHGLQVSVYSKLSFSPVAVSWYLFSV